MLFNSLMTALITYSLNVIYNLFLNRNLKEVFYSGLRWFMMTFLLVMLSQFVIYAFNDIRKEEYKSDNKNAAEDEADDNLKSKFDENQEEIQSQGNEAQFETESSFSPMESSGFEFDEN